jgi:predicted O-methyltransferase YrrM
MHLLPSLASGLLIAVLILTQRTLFPSPLTRRVMALLVMVVAFFAPRDVFGYKVWLYWFAAILVICVIARFIWRSDRMLRRAWPLLDVAGAGAFFAFTVTSIGGLASNQTSFVRLAPLLCLYLSIAASFHLFHELDQANVLQRPLGLTFAQAALIAGVLISVTSWSRVQPVAITLVPAGAMVMALRLRDFFSTTEERRVLARINACGETLQPEYTAPSFECPEPRLWSMFEAMTAEKEVLDLLYALVRAAKPRIVVETGTFSGISSTYIARALIDNGRGRLITCEMDPEAHKVAAARFEQQGLSSHIDLRLSSSFDLELPETIDLLYCDSDVNVREEEVRRFIDRVNPFGLILMHDAGSNFQVVRHGALRLEQEGLLSVVLVSTPRGLVVAQKRKGRI